MPSVCSWRRRPARTARSRGSDLVAHPQPQAVRLRALATAARRRSRDRLELNRRPGAHDRLHRDLEQAVDRRWLLDLEHGGPVSATSCSARPRAVPRAPREVRLQLAQRSFRRRPNRSRRLRLEHPRMRDTARRPASRDPRRRRGCNGGRVPGFGTFLSLEDDRAPARGSSRHAGVERRWPHATRSEPGGSGLAPVVCRGRDRCRDAPGKANSVRRRK